MRKNSGFIEYVDFVGERKLVRTKHFMSACQDGPEKMTLFFQRPDKNWNEWMDTVTIEEYKCIVEQL